MVNNVVRDMRVHLRRAALRPRAPITVHTFRKSFTQNHADSATPSPPLKYLMGHSSITTTKHYLQQSDANRPAATRRYEALLSDATCVKLACRGRNEPQTPSTARASSPQPLSPEEVT